MDIFVRGREIDAPLCCNLGVQGDNGVEKYRFIVSRYTSAGVDLSRGVAYFVFRLEDGQEGRVVLDTEADEQHVYLNLLVGAQLTAVKGKLTGLLHIGDMDGALWSSAAKVFSVSATIAMPSPQPVMFRSALRAAPGLTPEENPITVAERVMTIPADAAVIAVAQDENSTARKIIVPRFAGGVDMAEMAWYLHTEMGDNGTDDIYFNGELGQMKTVLDSTVELTWVLRPPQTSYSGKLRVQLLIEGTANGASFKRHTYIAEMTVNPHLSGEPVIPLEPEIMASFRAELETLRNAAKASETNAKASETAAAGSAAAAKVSENASGTSAASAQASKLAAEAAAGRAEDAAGTIGDSVQRAEQAAADAEASEKEAAGSAASAGQEAAEAAASEASAKAAQQAAEAAKVEAEKQAADAMQKATDADVSAKAAAESAAAADLSKTGAEVAKTEADKSKTAAAGSAAAAKTEADRAQGYAGQLEDAVTDKGVFATGDELAAKYPTGEDGWYATVTATETVWRWTGTAWVDTGIGVGNDYNGLKNRPSIEGVELEGNKTAEDLGLQPAGDYATAEAMQTGLAAKANRAAEATAGHVATLDADGNPVDSGKTMEEITPKDALTVPGGGTIQPAESLGAGPWTITVDEDPAEIPIEASQITVDIEENVLPNKYADLQVAIEGLYDGVQTAIIKAKVPTAVDADGYIRSIRGFGDGCPLPPDTSWGDLRGNLCGIAMPGMLKGIAISESNPLSVIAYSPRINEGSYNGDFDGSFGYVTIGNVRTALKCKIGKGEQFEFYPDSPITLPPNETDIMILELTIIFKKVS